MPPLSTLITGSVNTVTRLFGSNAIVYLSDSLIIVLGLTVNSNLCDIVTRLLLSSSHIELNYTCTRIPGLTGQILGKTSPILGLLPLWRLSGALLLYAVMDFIHLLALYAFLPFLFLFSSSSLILFFIFSGDHPQGNQAGLSCSILSPISLTPLSTSSKTPASSRFFFAYRYLYLHHRRTMHHRRPPHQLETCASPPLLSIPVTDESMMPDPRSYFRRGRSIFFRFQGCSRTRAVEELSHPSPFAAADVASEMAQSSISI